MSKGRKSLYTAITAIVLTFTNGLLGLITIRLIIEQYGSDFNGINSTANQFIAMLLIVEGGFTLATNVALFKPLSKKNYSEINGIMTASKNIFLKIGLLFFVVGILSSIIYALLIKSELPMKIAALTFIMTVVSTAFNLIYATKYRILLQTEQREYLLNIINVITIILSQTLVITIIIVDGNMLLIRFATMLGSIINSILIGFICRKKYQYLNFKSEPNYSAIKGTKDIFAQKISGMMYSTVPIIYISASVGTMSASVYAVYNSIFSLIKSVIYALINAPRMGFGQLIVEREVNYVRKIFLQYELIVIMALFCFLTTTALLIMPFINIYMNGIDDIDYQNKYVAGFLLATTLFEIIHIPSGIIINMSGNFKIGRRFQTAATIMLVAVMTIGSYIYGFYGILIAVLCTSILLAFLEITYVHKVYFCNIGGIFLKIIISNLIFAFFFTYIENLILPVIGGYLNFFVCGFVLVIMNGVLIISFNFLINRSIMGDILIRFKGKIKSNRINRG